ncbi:hypothetical protein [Ferruginibacter albus]|uniref:hypothetical protein n=1 Tax=Ferruginibacter albus TaxID=2875540 RepID=UPI001CC57083|nr:hypothetical protein [Ferruginibacter albus]UAY51683.1 hypothetical protein K9M53_13940 [Ferruginibacter albus]
MIILNTSIKGWLYLVVCCMLASCWYYPKAKVEKDKFPQIPNFPLFEDGKLKAQKVFSVYPAKETEVCYLNRNDTLFLVIITSNFSKDSYYLTYHIAALHSGKLFFTDSCLPGVSRFFTDVKGNVFFQQWKYYAPSYQRKDSLAYYDINSIRNKFQSAQYEGDTAVSKNDSLLHAATIKEESKFRQQVFNQIKEIVQVTPDNIQTKKFGAVENGQTFFLCNANSTTPFYIDANMFNTAHPEWGKNFEAIDSGYYYKMKDKVNFLPARQYFTDDMYDTTKRNIVTHRILHEFDKIVVENKWLKGGSRIIIEFGYKQVYLYYYDVTVNTIKTRTKINHQQHDKVEVYRAAKDFYIADWNIADNKLDIYYLQ